MSDEFDLNMNLRIHFEKDIKNFLSTVKDLTLFPLLFLQETNPDAKADVNMNEKQNYEAQAKILSLQKQVNFNSYMYIRVVELRTYWTGMFLSFLIIINIYNFLFLNYKTQITSYHQILLLYVVV